MRRLRLRFFSRWKNPKTGKHEWRHQTQAQITDHMIKIFEAECTGKICCKRYSDEFLNIPGIISNIEIQITTEFQFIITGITWTKCTPEQEIIAKLASEGSNQFTSYILETDYEIHNNQFKIMGGTSGSRNCYLCLRATAGMGVDTYKDYKAYFRARKVNDAKKAKQILS